MSESTTNFRLPLKSDVQNNDLECKIIELKQLISKQNEQLKEKDKLIADQDQFICEAKKIKKKNIKIIEANDKKEKEYFTFF